MGKIFCLMGKSSSGKDTIFGEIKKSFEYLLVPIIPYTTRPIRVGEVEGQAYHFISEQQLNEYNAQNKVIEQRVYQTVEGPWYYATIDDGNIDLGVQDYIVIVTLEAYNNLVHYFGKDRVVPIYIDVENGLRLERALKRERQQLNPNYDELCRRFLADNKDFSTANLQAAGIEKIYINDDINRCIDEISNDIKKMIK